MTSAFVSLVVCLGILSSKGLWKDPGRQNKKRPAEAAGSVTQVAHGGGNAVNYNATQPFRAKNSKANDK
jgi:hypothetical protein